MARADQFTCFIVSSEGTLPAQCAEILLGGGHELLGIVSGEAAVRRWAGERGVAHFEPAAPLRDLLSRQPFDYLFSINNYQILGEDVLSLPRRLAINYHDALLPRYAGMHATSWALMNREAAHGVTWHVVSGVVDAGDILQQRAVAVADDDTAFTLNMKCYEAALASFAELVESLAAGRASARPQSLDERTYYPLFKKPKAAGLISWDRPARDVHALVRALDLGNYRNALGTPKLSAPRGSLIVSELEVLNTASGLAAGTVVRAGADSLVMATADYDVAVRKALTLGGRPLSPADLAARFGLVEGVRCEGLRDEEASCLEALVSATARHENFWVERLASLKPCVPPHAQGGQVEAGEAAPSGVRLSLPEEVRSFMAEGREGVGPATFLLAAHAAFLTRLVGEVSFDLGFAGPGLRRELEGGRGLFARHVPLRVELERRQSFADVVRALAAEVESVVRRKTYLRDVVARYPLLRSAAQSGTDYALPVVVEVVERLDDRGADAAGALTLFITADGSECLWAYDAGRLDRGSVERWARHFVTFLRGAVENPARSIAELPLLNGAERRRLLVEWNQTATPYSHDLVVHELFEAQAERTPDSVAAVSDEGQLTYGELNRRANILARRLRELGVGPEAAVGLCVERSPEMLVGLLGILKSGGAYVPLDPAYPAARLSFMLEDSRPAVLVTQQRLLSRLPEFGGHLIRLDADGGDSARADEGNLARRGGPENLAYVIYTSGSTGKPKGVGIPHGAVVNFLESMRRRPGLEARDSILAITTLSFDMAVPEVFLPLTVGARVTIAGGEDVFEGTRLARRLAESGTTVMQATPATWRLLLEAGWQGAEGLRVLCGAEALSRELAEQLLKRCGAFWNMYGPTESTVWSAVHKVESAEGNVPIGRPIANTQIYVLDPDMNPAPVGTAGELHIGGAGLARGYLKRPALTAEKFVPDPFGGKPGARLYRTGDLACFLPDGNVEFLGRLDHQVKLRGFRIELGEVEHALAQQADLRGSVVLVREDVPGDQRLVAYMVAEPGREVSAKELRAGLGEKLPAFMIPSSFVWLERFPLTGNGKINRAALPAPESSGRGVGASKPRTQLEETLAGLWAEVLGLERVGVDDNFFELGGHSLLAMRLVARVRERVGLDVPVPALFKSPTVAELARRVEAERDNGRGEWAHPVRRAERGAEAPLSLEQEAWMLGEFWERLHAPEGRAANVHAVVRLSGRLDVPALERAVGEIVRRHEILRTTFPGSDGTPPADALRPLLGRAFETEGLWQEILKLGDGAEPDAFISALLGGRSQRVAADAAEGVNFISLREVAEAQRIREAMRVVGQEMQRPFDYSEGPLMRATLLEMGEAEHVFCLVMHPLVADGCAVASFVRELTVLYKAFLTGEPSPLGELPIQYSDFAHWQRDYLRGERLREMVSYWEGRYERVWPFKQLELPFAHSDPNAAGADYQSITLPAPLHSSLKALGARAGVTLHMVLLAAFKTLLHRYTGAERLWVVSPLDNRHRAGARGMVGTFAHVHALTSDLSGDPRFSDLLEQVRQTVVGAYEHQDIPFSLVLRSLLPRLGLAGLPRRASEVPYVFFHFRNQMQVPEPMPGLSVNQFSLPGGPSDAGLRVVASEQAGALHVGVSYSADRFRKAGVGQALLDFQTLLEGVAADPAGRLSSMTAFLSNPK